MLLRHALQGISDFRPRYYCPQRRSIDSYDADQPTHDARGGCHAPQSHACSIRRKALLAALRKAPSRWSSETVRPAIGGLKRIALRPGTPPCRALVLILGRPPPRHAASTP